MWMEIEWRGNLSDYAHKPFEDLPDRLAEAFSRILHARGLRGIATIPCRTAPYAAMVIFLDYQLGDHSSRRND